MALTYSYNLFSLLVCRMMTNGDYDDEEEELDGKKRELTVNRVPVLCGIC